MTTHGIRRRQALAGAAGVAVGTPLLAACGDDASQVADDAASAAESAGDAASSAAGDAVERLSDAADIPEGSGRVFADQQVVVTQPEAGEFKAFSALCTHQGCVVQDVTDTINCGCHGSQFDISDGSVVTGPATQPLPPAEIDVSGDGITLG
jgi:Rieske Fe-S protein